VPTLPELALSDEGREVLPRRGQHRRDRPLHPHDTGRSADRTRGAAIGVQTMLKDPAFLAACKQRKLMVDGAPARDGRDRARDIAVAAGGRRENRADDCNSAGAQRRLGGVTVSDQLQSLLRQSNASNQSQIQQAGRIVDEDTMPERLIRRDHGQEIQEIAFVGGCGPA